MDQMTEQRRSQNQVEMTPKNSLKTTLLLKQANIKDEQ